jgi:acyl-CoA synthetase (AMP-forming)/AMP-acid ligase II
MDLLSTLCETVARHPDDIFSVVCQDSNGSTSSLLSYQGAWRSIEHHKNWIQKTVISSFGKQESGYDVVIAFLASNSVDMFLSMLACTSSTFASPTPLVALLNIRWTPLEMTKVLESKTQTAKTLLLYGPEFESAARKVVSSLTHKACCLPLHRAAHKFSMKLLLASTEDANSEDETDQGVERRIEEASANASQRDALLVFTSGTESGGSKGVRLSHRALIVQALAKLQYPCNYSKTTAMLATTVPLFHVGGISSSLAVVLAGGRLIFPYTTTTTGFDAGLVWQSLSFPHTPVNTLVVVPAMLVTLFGNHTFSKAYANVRLILIGGQSATRITVEHISKVFPNARIVQTYACTEAASSLTFLQVQPLETNTQKSVSGSPGDCVGSSPPHVELKLYRKEDMNVTEVTNIPYQPGIIATRGPHVMSGYWNRGVPQTTDNVQGWFSTNDLGFFDTNGLLYFCGRVRDVIRTGGETVLAQEVERTLLLHPEVMECAIFPRRDERFGEAVACALVPKGGSLELATIKKWCEQYGLANYKRPRYLFLVNELPRNSSGKVLKHKLTATFQSIPSRL